METDGNEFLEYVALQDSSAMVTKDELLEKVNSKGADVSPRQLTTFVGAGLVPRSTRIGSQAGVYPKIVVELVIAISRARSAGVSVEALRELVPVWKCLMRARRDRRLDLSDFEKVVRENVRSIEAAYAVAWVFQYWVPLMLLGMNSNATRLEIIDKKGNRLSHTFDNRVSIGFVVAETDGDDIQHRNSMRVMLPIEDERNLPTTIIAGIPNGIDPPACPLGHRSGPEGWQERRPHLGRHDHGSVSTHEEPAPT